MVDNKTDLERTVSRLREHGSFGLDMEFQRERTFRPRLQLVQVSTPDESLLIDPLAFEELDSLWDVVEDPSIEKIVHAGSQDMEIVFARSGKLPHNIFDTQIAAALLGLGDQIGYANLISRMLHRRLKKGETVTDWSIRPLSNAQVEYALDDVRYLHEIREKLWAKLASMGRETWLREETEHYEERRTYERDPQTLWARISRMRSLDPKGLSILRELAIWREEEAQRRDEPRGRIVADETLVEIARRGPKKPEDLKPLRTLHPREQEILRIRYGIDGRTPCTLEQLGRKFHLSRERIRQLERQAILKLKHRSDLVALKEAMAKPSSPLSLHTPRHMSMN